MREERGDIGATTLDGGGCVFGVEHGRIKKMSAHLAIEQPLFKDKPHGWIQWKGTNVCIDLHCTCGAHIHFDGDFLYNWLCPKCDRLWEMGTHMPMYEVAAERREEVLKEDSVQHPEAEDVWAVTPESASPSPEPQTTQS